MLIKTDFCLKPFNTLGVEVETRQAALITSLNDLNELFEDGHLQKQQILILGEGSNILFTNHFEGLVLLNQMRGKKIIEETDEYVFLKVNSGEYWSSLVDFTVENEWAGLENLSMIPGTVGAAPVQNIGAYGVELKDIMHSLEAFDLELGEVVQFTNEDCEFAYRDSIFKKQAKGRYFVLNVTFRLSKNPIFNLEYGLLKQAFADVPSTEINIKQISEFVKSIRRSKLPEPEELKNAGSFFKNPVVSSNRLTTLKDEFPEIPSYILPNQKHKLAAAWLIEQCGWKGKRVGDAGVYEKQALVLVNYDKAKGKELLALSEAIRQSVKEKFGVDLETEVNVI